MNRTSRLEIDEALRQRELDEDLSQKELVSRCSAHANGDADYTNPNSCVGLFLWQVYLGGVKAASHYSRMVFAGVDMTEGY